MPADREARSRLRDALIAYMRGDIHTFAFDDINSAYLVQRHSEDQSLQEVSKRLWTFHDDFIDHPISVPSEGWIVLQRVVAFLATDLESETVGEPTSPAWPFRDASEWLKNEHLSRDCGLLEYDASVHCRQVHPWWLRIPTSVGVAVIIGLIALMFGFVLLTAPR
jgi:hypothetical protein